MLKLLPESVECVAAVILTFVEPYARRKGFIDTEFHQILCLLQISIVALSPAGRLTTDRWRGQSRGASEE